MSVVVVLVAVVHVFVMIFLKIIAPLAVTLMPAPPNVVVAIHLAAGDIREDNIQ